MLILANTLKCRCKKRTRVALRHRDAQINRAAGFLLVMIVMLQAHTPPKPRILILDEDRIILQSLSQFLARDGYEVKTSDDPSDALAQFEASQFELLLADINMPG